MILLIDVGNTRLKWAWLTSAGLSDQQAVVHRDANADLWAAALFDASLQPTRVLISNVAGEPMARNLARLAKKTFGVKAEFVTATRQFLELTNGYLDPSLLGTDRWLAVIGAWTKARSALCRCERPTPWRLDRAGHSHDA
jgi:type III pantothenate kinase